MNKILMTVQFAQDVDDKLGSDRTLGRQFWVATKTDLAWALDTVESEVHKYFEFATEGVTETFKKEGSDE